MDETYNGWVNYETWLVNPSGLTNDEDIYRRSRDTARAAMSDFAGGESIAVMLPDWLELPESGLAADLLNAIPATR